MSENAVLTIYDDLRCRLLNIDDRHGEPTGFIFSLAQAGIPLDAANFRNPWTPASVGAADENDRFESLTNLSNFVNRKLMMDGSGRFMPASTSISATWKIILDAAEPSPNRPVPSEESLKRVEAAYRVLYKPSADNADQEVETPEYSAYKICLAAYNAALRQYSDEYYKAMSTEATKAQWPVKGKTYLIEVEQALNEWTARGKKEKIEAAQATLNAQGKDAVEAVIAQSKKIFDPWQVVLGGVAQATPYVSVLPKNWAEPNPTGSGWSTYGMYKNNMRTEHSESARNWGANAGWSLGFWSIGGGGTNATKHDEFNSDDLAVELTYGVATIYRPWLNTTLVNVSGWRLLNQDRYVISDGNKNQKNKADEALWLPSIPTQMLIVKNVRIKTSKVQNIFDYQREHTNGGGSFGWGPFTVGGSGGSDSETTKTSSHLEGEWLVIDGAQLIGWVSEILPACPTDSGK